MDEPPRLTKGYVMEFTMAKSKKQAKVIFRISQEVKNQFKAYCALRNVTMSSKVEKLILAEMEQKETTIPKK